MPAIGGSIESVTLDGRSFSVAADVDATRKLGGDENEVVANGDGTGRIQKTKTPWSIDGLSVNVDDSRADLEFIQNLADGNVFFPVTLTLASGITYQGIGILTGEIGASTQSATASISLMGEGKLTPQ